jgi:hypothetical protein
MPATLLEKLSYADAQTTSERLPENIRAAMITRAAEVKHLTIEKVVKMAIASLLSTEALGFVECKPGWGH